MLPASAWGLDVRAQYEDDLIRRALERRGLLPEPAPEGQVIERVEIDASQVILPGDFPLSRWIPWTWANYLHVRTREDVLRRELLFQAGERFRAAAITETERALRGTTTGVPGEARFLILAVARVVAARGSAPGRVVVVVVTKDQWSLRLNSNFTLDQDRLDYLSFSMAEGNLAGRGKYVAVDFALDPGRYQVGGQYLDPRVWGSRHFFRGYGGLYLDRGDSHPEGGYLSLSGGRPLYTLRTAWAWEARVSYTNEKRRNFNGGDLRQLVFPQSVSGGAGPVTVQDVYRREALGGSLEVTRSFGVASKVNVSLGYRLSWLNVGLSEEFPTDAGREVRRAYRWLLPRGEGAAGPYVSLSAYRARYARLRDVDTFALSEDFRLGPQLDLDVQYANPHFGMTSEFLSLYAAYAHAFLWGENLLTYGVAAQGRVQSGVYLDAVGVSPEDGDVLRYLCQAAGVDGAVPVYRGEDCAGSVARLGRLLDALGAGGVGADGPLLVNQALSFSLREVSPRLGPVRLHVHASLNLRQRDLSRTRLSLGSDSGLRGFAPRALVGNSSYLLNVELRSLALNLWTLHVGGVLFYDGGDAPASLRTGGWRHDVGAGLRVLIPQFNRVVLRVDLGFPLELPRSGSYAPRVSAEFNQAF